MTATGKTPAAVVAASALYLLFGAFVLFGGVLAASNGGGPQTLVAGLFSVVLMGVLAWRLRAGSRGAQVTAIVLSLLLAVTTLRFPNLALIAVPIGLITVPLLTLPSSARAHFRGDAEGRTQLRPSRAR